MTDEPYWPDLTRLPPGWRLTQITWRSGRATAHLSRSADKSEVASTGNHHSPRSAFDAACNQAKAMT
jgi:hypothetical protein